MGGYTVDQYSADLVYAEFSASWGVGNKPIVHKTLCLDGTESIRVEWRGPDVQPFSSELLVELLSAVSPSGAFIYGAVRMQIVAWDGMRRCYYVRRVAD